MGANRQRYAKVARWLALTLAGWLLYALIRALRAFVRLGVPVFDWQWYLSIIVVLAIPMVCLVWHRPRFKLARFVLLGLLSWLLVGYFGWGQKVYVYPARADPIPISFWTGKAIVEMPNAVLEDLQIAGGSLYIVVGAQAFDGEKGRTLVEGLRRLAEHDIDVFLAVVVHDYLSVPVYDVWSANVRETAAAVQDEGLTNVRGIMGDAEQPKNMPLDLLGTDRDSFFRGVQDLTDLIQQMQREYPGLLFGVTALWTLYLDSFDGDADLSIIHRSSVDPPGGWDFVNVMTYSSYIPSSWRAYYVYLVERVMARLHPVTRARHLLGLTAEGRPGEPVLSFDDLVRDAQLSRAMGVPEVIVFKLNSLVLEDWGHDFVRRFVRAVNEVPPEFEIEIPFSRPASMMVYGTLCLDALLDIRSWRGLWFLAWMILSGLVVYRNRFGVRSGTL